MTWKSEYNMSTNKYDWNKLSNPAISGDSVKETGDANGFGTNIKLNYSGDEIAILYPQYNNNKGAVFTYSYIGETWKNTYDTAAKKFQGSSGESISHMSLSKDSHTIAVGSEAYGSNKGAVWTYKTLHNILDLGDVSNNDNNINYAGKYALFNIPDTLTTEGFSEISWYVENGIYKTDYPLQEIVSSEHDITWKGGNFLEDHISLTDDQISSINTFIQNHKANSEYNGISYTLTWNIIIYINSSEVLWYRVNDGVENLGKDSNGNYRLTDMGSNNDNNGSFDLQFNEYSESTDWVSTGSGSLYYILYLYEGGPTLITGSDPKTINLRSVNVDERFAYTLGDNNGMNYDHGNPVKVTCPDDTYKIIIKSVQSDGATVTYDTGVDGIENIENYILGLPDPGGFGNNGGLWYSSGGTQSGVGDWDHWSINFYVYMVKK
jgi:hypothetical protein